MKISKIIAKQKQENKKLFSFEFFPPKTEQGCQHLIETAYKLKSLHPAFVSITYGAGGGTRRKTRELTVKIQNEVGLVSMAHLTCMGSSKEEIYDIVNEYRLEGIENLLALRGDPPKGEQKFQVKENGFSHANELIQFIRANFGDKFALGSAGYPEKHQEAVSMEKDIEYLKMKVDAGTQFIITQLFLDNNFFYKFVEKAKSAGIDVPILAGIMPITDFKQIQRFSDFFGAHIPGELVQPLTNAMEKQNKEEIRQIGIDWATAQCRDLLTQGVDGIHFYTLNKSLPTLEIFKNLH